MKNSLVKQQKFFSDETGTIAITFALMGTVMFSSIGVAIDIGRSHHAKARMQNALDAAAVAALKTSADQRQTVGTAFFYSNLQTGFGTASAPQVETLGNGSVRVTATMTVPTTISRLMRIEKLEVSGESVVDPKRTTTSDDTTETEEVAGGVPCIHVMDQSAIDALKMISNSNLRADTCDVYVRSNRSQALYGDSNSSTRFHNVKVKGSAVESSGKIIVVGDPFHIEEDAPVVGNPYLSAIRQVTQVIPQPSCSAANTGKTYNGGTVNPGTYCGATVFNGVRFNQGLYVIASGNGAGKEGRLTLRGRLDGSAGVSFYFADSKSNLASYRAAEESVLKAPKTGLTRGLLFFEGSDRGGKWSLSFDSVNKQTWEGLVYFPAADVVMRSLSEWPKMNVSLAVNTLQMISLSTVFTPFAWIPYNATAPVTYDPTVITHTVSTSTDHPIHISK